MWYNILGDFSHTLLMFWVIILGFPPVVFRVQIEAVIYAVPMAVAIGEANFYSIVRLCSLPSFRGMIRLLACEDVCFRISHNIS